MLHAVGGEDGALVRVELDRHSDHERALGNAEPPRDRVAHAGVRERLLELGQRLVEERRLPLEGGGLELFQPRHGPPVYVAGFAATASNPTRPCDAC